MKVLGKNLVKYNSRMEEEFKFKDRKRRKAGAKKMKNDKGKHQIYL